MHRSESLQQHSKHTRLFIINPDKRMGGCRGLKAQYYKTSPANFIRTGDQGATGVAVWESNE